MHGFVVRYPLIIGIGIVNRTIFNACGTPRTFVLDDVAGFGGQRDFEITRLSLNAVHVGECQNLYVWMPADLDQFR
jgi:hypothetical protein